MSETSTTVTSADEQRVIDQIDALLADHDPTTTDEQEFWGAQFDHGLAWVHFPEGHGGLGVSPRHQKLVNERLTDAGASFRNRRVNVIGIGMGAATIIEHGTDAQKDRYLRPLFTLEEVWCQLFSEPGAGSDLAGLATTALQDGDEWIVNGQKVWTTLAHISRWGLLVARHDPEQVKHRGLTYFIADMEADGVEVRPLYQITGEAEFNEVYFTDVRIPDDNRLGDVGAGWSVAMTTLMNERVAIGGNVVPRESGAIGQAVKVWNDRGHDDPVKRDELMKLWVEAEAMRLTTWRANDLRRRGTPGPEGSTAKLQWADLNKAISSFAMELLGSEGMLYPGGYPMSRPTMSGSGTGTPQKQFLRARANSIEGGTSEIMRNILGERVLGLAGEPRTDKDVPWRDVPRS